MTALSGIGPFPARDVVGRSTRRAAPGPARAAAARSSRSLALIALGQRIFAGPAFMTTLEVAFANLYFAAAGAADSPAAVPLA